MSATDDRYENAVARYFEAWNATDRDALAKAVAAAWSTDGSYTDPLAEVRGHEGIAAVIAAAHEQFPGFSFRPAGPVDGHHDIARFGWELVNAADGTAPVAGFDVITLDGEDRIRSVHGFLDRVPTQ
ncbi:MULTISPECIES: nuclear transport factor 2 family protein [Streptomyces]|jgi:ketosteroid isomerase-like protein|uniref:nuclear transport factor 2 family protein n=1 Tax=Streptomyces TaxID=1883 RepID=UPI0009C961B9|nr:MULTISPECIES: nuclear transport factor 2 family protein [unclassified Streptomyces]MCZ1004280.1 nuclear transport factor 2 family protein [Streptomyces mirabilis]KAF5991945.1 polyketide cyclase [Streptomyces sp. WAC00263]QDN74379.1 nuclear transport factor 2 family protein [Streptomyces sp. S1A1-7]QDN76003.1 nuclear transport factor 2 family protein [Streptomyces sp. S1A1-7]QDN85666.1 nuclear transport factor 2 family protein [Streptomyces sp. RLB3-6]